MAARSVLAVVLALYGGWLLLDYQWHFVDGANLLFHEAGHVFFGLLGRTIGVLGGTLGQLFFPVAAMAHFLRRGSPAEAAAAIVWLGENLMNVSVYAADARVQVLPRVGGEIHDWHYLLARCGLLAHDREVAGALHAAGAVVVVAGVALAVRAVVRHREGAALAGAADASARGERASAAGTGRRPPGADGRPRPLPGRAGGEGTGVGL